MGLLTEGINEVIATTRSNAAPMGIISRGGVLRMILFHGSHTAANIERDGWVVANFVYDPVLYVRCAFEDLPEEEFVEEDAAGLTVHRLRDAEAWAAFDAMVTGRGPEAITVALTPRAEQLIECRLHPVNRGFAGIIEATVHATRYVRTGDAWLRTLIEHHAALVRRCGGQREWEALELLVAYIEELRPDL